MRPALLTFLMLLGLAAGVIYGQYVLFDPANPVDRTHWTFVAGDLVLIRPLMLLVGPMLLVGAVSAARSLRQASRFSLAMSATGVYFAVSTIVAAILGTVAAYTVKPGELTTDTRQQLIASAPENYAAATEVSRGVQATINAGQDTLSGAWLAMLRRAVPASIISDLATGQWLGLVVLALLLGVGLAAGGDRARATGAVFDAIAAALRLITQWFAWLAPMGVCLLVANSVGTIGLDALRNSLERYCLVVAGALMAHAVVVLPVALLIFGRCNPITFAGRAAAALCVALGTASSNATLPIAIEAAADDDRFVAGMDGTRRKGSACSRSAVNLVLPLGTVLNRNGTALFQAAAVVFLCQVSGVALSMNELVVIVIAASVAAVSTLGVPSAGLITLIIVITAVNTSLAGREPLPITAIGVLLVVDRLLDMCRTAVNVWANLVGARIITTIAPDEEPVAAIAQPASPRSRASAA